MFLIIAVAIFALLVVGMLYGVLTDPARIDEEEDKEVEQESPEERHGFLRATHRFSKQDSADRIAEESKADYGGGEINDL